MVDGLEVSVRDFIKDSLAHAVGRTLRDSDLDLTFEQLGVDSLSAVALLGELEERYGVTIDPALASESPTIAALAGHVEAALRTNRAAYVTAS
jgi:acyl carrier protein